MHSFLIFEMFVTNVADHREGRLYGSQLWLSYSTQETSMRPYHAPAIMADGGNSAVIETLIRHWRSCFQKHLSTLKVQAFCTNFLHKFMFACTHAHSYTVCSLYWKAVILVPSVTDVLACFPEVTIIVFLMKKQ